MTIGGLTLDLARHPIYTRLTVTTPRATTTLHWSANWRRPYLRLNSGHVARWFGSSQQEHDRPYRAQYSYRGLLGTHVQF